MELETNTGTCILQIDLINVAFEQKPKHHATGNKHRYMYIIWDSSRENLLEEFSTITLYSIDYF